MTLAAGALSAAVLMAPASAFLAPGVRQSCSVGLASSSCGSMAASAARRPRGATTLHNSEAFGNSNSNNNNNAGGAKPDGFGAEDLQHALFKTDARRVILFDGDCGFCSEGACADSRVCV